MDRESEAVPEWSVTLTCKTYAPEPPAKVNTGSSTDVEENCPDDVDGPERTLHVIVCDPPPLLTVAFRLYVAVEVEAFDPASTDTGVTSRNKIMFDGPDAFAPIAVAVSDGAPEPLAEKILSRRLYWTRSPPVRPLAREAFVPAVEWLEEIPEAPEVKVPPVATICVQNTNRSAAATVSDGQVTRRVRCGEGGRGSGQRLLSVTQGLHRAVTHDLDRRVELLTPRVQIGRASCRERV